MFLKTILTFLIVGALSVNAMTTPIARSPAPEPESQELEAWMLKRDLSYDLFSRELQALDKLFSREPQDGKPISRFPWTPEEMEESRRKREKSLQKMRDEAAAKAQKQCK